MAYTYRVLNSHQIRLIEDYFSALKQVNMAQLVDTALAGGSINGVVAPSGAVTPTFIGQTYIDTNTGNIYISYGLTNSDWTQVNN